MSDECNHNWAGFGLWWSDFVTQFLQGAIRGGMSGAGAGSTTGGAAAATGIATDIKSVALIGAAGFASMIFWNGYNNAAVWARDHPIPNPLRPVPQAQLENQIK